MARGEKEPEKLSNKKYEKELRKLQGELCKLQEWVKHERLRVIIVFEGRDAAGKGGTIKAITERVSPRVFRLVALPAPSDREKTQLYMQRYVKHFPAAGEVVIFDRSWYNRAGVERVMGFATEEQIEGFLDRVAEYEKDFTRAGLRCRHLAVSEHLGRRARPLVPDRLHSVPGNAPPSSRRFCPVM